MWSPEASSHPPHLDTILINSPYLLLSVTESLKLCNTMNWRKSHRCPGKIRNLQHISCSTWGPVVGPRGGGLRVENGLEMNTSGASICRAHIHYQMHSLLASSAQWLSPWLQSHAEWCSRWGVEVVNVYDSTLSPFLHPPPSSSSSPPLDTQVLSLFVVTPSSTLRERRNLEA